MARSLLVIALAGALLADSAAAEVFKKEDLLRGITITRAQCEAIYRADYWDPLRCDALNPGVSFVLFNDAVLSGVDAAVRLLQRSIGAAEDGVVGPQTLRMANAMPAAQLIDRLTVADEKHLASLRNAPMFIRGWDRRELACQAEALTLVA